MCARTFGTQFEKIKASFVTDALELASEMEKLAPNLKAIEHFQDIRGSFCFPYIFPSRTYFFHALAVGAVAVVDRLKASNEDFEAKKKALKQAGDLYEQKRELRKELFMKAFDHVAGEIGSIYTKLTKTPGASTGSVLFSPLSSFLFLSLMVYFAGGTAHLSLENSEEPYLHGVKYTAMPPSKRFREMDQVILFVLFVAFGLHCVCVGDNE